MEPLQKELIPGITAHLDADGTLTLTQEHTVDESIADYDGSLLVDEPVITTMQLPAQAARALLKFLRREQSRERIGYRLWQKEGSSQK